MNMMNQSLHIFIDIPDSDIPCWWTMTNLEIGWPSCCFSENSPCQTTGSGTRPLRALRALGFPMDPILGQFSKRRGENEVKSSHRSRCRRWQSDDSQPSAISLRQLTVASLTCMAVSVAKVPTSFLSSKSQVIGWWDCGSEWLEV